MHMDYFSTFSLLLQVHCGGTIDGDLSWLKGTQSNTFCSVFLSKPSQGGFDNFFHWYLYKNRYNVSRVWNMLWKVPQKKYHKRFELDRQIVKRTLYRWTIWLWSFCVVYSNLQNYWWNALHHFKDFQKWLQERGGPIGVKIVHIIFITHLKGCILVLSRYYPIQWKAIVDAARTFAMTNNHNWPSPNVIFCNRCCFLHLQVKAWTLKDFGNWFVHLGSVCAEIALVVDGVVSLKNKSAFEQGKAWLTIKTNLVTANLNNGHYSRLR